MVGVARLLPCVQARDEANPAPPAHARRLLRADHQPRRSRRCRERRVPRHHQRGRLRGHRDGVRRQLRMARRAVRLRGRRDLSYRRLRDTRSVCGADRSGRVRRRRAMCLGGGAGRIAVDRSMSRRGNLRRRRLLPHARRLRGRLHLRAADRLPRERRLPRRPVRLLEPRDRQQRRRRDVHL